MELLDRYLNAVRSCLPEAQRDDIINELSENLRSQIEDQEASLGRPLTEAEVEAILKQHGHPLLVAGRFRQDQRSLAFGHEIIGPTLFPFYLRVLKFNLGITTLILLALFTALFLGGQVVKAGIFPVFLDQFLIQFAVVTLIFYVADRHWKKHPDRWDARKLKHPWHPAFATQFEPKLKFADQGYPARVSRFDSVAQVVALCIGLAWLRIAQGAPFMIFGPAAAFLRPAPVWHQFYWPVVGLALLGIVQALINLLRPDWVRLLVVYRGLTAAAWVVVFFFLIKARQSVVLATDGPQADGFRRTVDILDHISIYIVAGLTVVAVYGFVRHLRRLVRLRRSDIPSPAKS
jgi:hypothetical protein